MAMLTSRNNQNENMISKFNEFRKEIERSGKNPQQILDELIASGKYSQKDIDRAKQMAMLYKNILGGR